MAVPASSAASLEVHVLAAQGAATYRDVHIHINVLLQCPALHLTFEGQYVVCRWAQAGDSEAESP